MDWALWWTRLLNHVVNYRRVNDCIATMDLSLPLRNGHTTKCRIVNVYGPTTERAQENPSLVESLYDALSTAIKVPSRWLLYVCGDFNANLGELSKCDNDAGLGMGSYRMGKRNNNGEAFPVVRSNKYKACIGWHCTNFLSLLWADLKDEGLGTLRTAKKLKELRMLARNKMKWIQMKKDWMQQ